MIVRGPLPTRSYTVLQNELLRDRRLSWKARGLLAYLLSQPPGWTTRTEHLAGVAPDGRDSVRSGLRELEAAGYLRRWRTRADDGRWEWHTVVYDDPVNNSATCPQTTSDYPSTENPGANNYRESKYIVGNRADALQSDPDDLWTSTVGE